MERWYQQLRARPAYQRGVIERTHLIAAGRYDAPTFSSLPSCSSVSRYR